MCCNSKDVDRISIINLECARSPEALPIHLLVLINTLHNKRREHPHARRINCELDLFDAQHLRVCPECHEQFQALVRSVE